ncbi:hypothetical protein GT360_18740 [Vibrio astriarenae]|uniref:Uncharacterized protein n=1 Tax=Vibrio astriarenae TaxID=1481923 RepID=A0A7Z2YFX7_9VIBR|nr:hypothetical protein [Vibrio astriarenae]QIA65570.1 hypothetical protein GT360_18740 [Vibrio astriarenae]
MTTIAKRGRPKLTETVKLERKVACQYIKLIELRNQFNVSVPKLHPTLTPSQQKALIQPIFSVAEEYRFWSQLDNDLLAIQRHSCPKTRFDQSSVEILARLDQLIISYELVISSRQQLEQQSSLAVPNDFELWIELVNQLKLQPFDTQTHQLYQLARFLYGLLYPSFQIDQVKQIRTIIRTVLDLIKHHRLSMVYHITPPNVTGRPTIPLPIQVVRAEEELITQFNKLSTLYKFHQLKIPTPKSIAAKYSDAQLSTLGRPKLSERQKLEQAILRREKELIDLTDKHSAQPELQKVTAARRGRKPMTYQERHKKLTQQITTLKTQLHLLLK